MSQLPEMPNCLRESYPMDIDVSNHTFINKIWHVRDAPQIIVETSIFLPVVFVGIFGNLLSIDVLLKNPHIRSPTNLLIGNMALADLLSLMFHPTTCLVYDLFQNYQLGSIGCRLEGAIECTILISSVMSVSVISYDRLTAIVLPMETRLNKKGTKVVIAVIWIVSFVVSSPLIVYRTYQERQWKDFLEKFCSENIFVTVIYWHVIITVLVWLPLGIQLICYISIFVKLKKYSKAVLRKLNSRQNYKRRAAVMMFAIIAIFMVCRLPFTALIFYREKLHRQEEFAVAQGPLRSQNTITDSFHTLWFTSKFLMVTNAAINPLIYGLTNEKFRKCFSTTKLAKWLFPPQNRKTAAATAAAAVTPKPALKAVETSPNKNHTCFIFRKQLKSISYQVKNNNTIEMVESKSNQTNPELF